MILNSIFNGSDIFHQYTSIPLFNFLSDEVKNLFPFHMLHVEYLDNVSIDKNKMIFSFSVLDLSKTKDWNSDKNPNIDLIFDSKNEEFSISEIWW